MLAHILYILDNEQKIFKGNVCEIHKIIPGQAPSDHPDFALFLVEAGIDCISLNPDSVIEVKKRVAKKEKQFKLSINKGLLDG